MPLQRQWQLSVSVSAVVAAPPLISPPALWEGRSRSGAEPPLGRASRGKRSRRREKKEGK